MSEELTEKQKGQKKAIEQINEIIKSNDLELSVKFISVISPKKDVVAVQEKK